ncbi:MAG: hypothetical protein HRT37_09845 [Alteromonadaceae bacterium]|nr:hypothetical protein [Alteromonadaceae bacterium]
MKTRTCKFQRIISTLFMLFTVTSFADQSTGNLVTGIVKQQVSVTHWHSLQDNEDWGYTLETLLINGNGKKQQRVQSYDPGKPLESQWQLLEQQYEKPTKSILHEYKKTRQAIESEEVPEEKKG